MRDFHMSFGEMFASFWRNKSLIRTLVVRDIQGRYRGSLLGLAWSFFQPIFLLIIYTFVFSVIFKARWGTGSDSKTEFALVLFAGLIVFNFFAECINRAPGIILANNNYVKKVVFPLEILPWVSLGTSLFLAVASLIVWLLFYLIMFGIPKITVLLLPLLIIPVLLITIGLSWFFAATGVYLRDISQLVGIITTLFLFLSPIFYPISSLPGKYQLLLNLNPLTPAIEAIRNAMYWGISPNFKSYMIYTFCSILFAWLGFSWFQKTRQGFADVL